MRKTDIEALLENYEIHRDGTIINKRLGVPVKASKTEKGYMKARLRTELSTNKDGRKPYFIHRVIAMAFLDFDDKLQVNHINGDKTDNRIDNLEMVTASYNVKHTYEALGRKCKLQRDKKGRFI